MGSNKLAVNLHENDRLHGSKTTVRPNSLLCGRMCTMECPSNVIQVTFDHSILSRQAARGSLRTGVNRRSRLQIQEVAEQDQRRAEHGPGVEPLCIQQPTCGRGKWDPQE